MYTVLFREYDVVLKLEFNDMIQVHSFIQNRTAVQWTVVVETKTGDVVLNYKKDVYC